MLFKGTATRTRRGHRAGDRFDRRPARRVHREGIRELLHQGARRASAARHRHPLRHRPQSGVQRRDDIEREKKVVLEEIKMVEDTPDDLVHELFTQGFWENHPLGRPILGTKETVESFNADSLRAYFTQRLHRAEPDRLRRRQPRARARARSRRGEVRLAGRAGRIVRDEAPRVVPKMLGAQQGARAEPPVPGRQQLSAESRRSVFELRAEHAARRFDELAAVSERPREARAGLRGVQRPERVSRRGLVHDLRRLLERSGRRSDRSRSSRSCAASRRRRCRTPSCSGRRII